MFNQKEYMKSYHKEWKLKNPEKRKEGERKWNLKNKEKKKQSTIQFRKENPNYTSEYNKKNKINEYKNNYIKNRMKNDIKFKLITNLRTSLYCALKTYTEKGKIMSSKKYGIDWSQVIKKLIETKPKDFEEKRNTNNPYTIDHIKPLVSFNLENSEEIKQAFAPENHQWLLFKDNCSKGDKYE